jgi:hypothetical protein
MILGFKERFKQPILDGIKIHTIREDKANKWSSEYYIHFATGVRTKKFNMFKVAPCVSVQKIDIEWMTIGTINRASVKIDNICVGCYTNRYPFGLCYFIAKNDGFDNVHEFFQFFNKDFHGKIIHWTNCRY